MMSFGIAGLALVLAIVTDRFFKDPIVDQPVFKGRKLIWIIGVYILSVIVVVYWSRLALKGMPSSALSGSWRDILPQLGLIAVIFVIQLPLEKAMPNSFGFCLPKTWPVLIPPFIFFFGSSLLNLGWAREVKINILMGGTLLVVTEEIVFRGFIQNELERIFGIQYMWIAAGFLFGLWHIPTDFWGYQFLHQDSYVHAFGQLAMQTCGGLWACAIYKKTRSLYPLMLFHWMGNNFHLHLYHTIRNLF